MHPFVYALLFGSLYPGVKMISFLWLLLLGSACSTSLFASEEEGEREGEEPLFDFEKDSPVELSKSVSSSFPEFIKYQAPLLEGFYVHENFLTEASTKTTNFCPFQHLNSFESNIRRLLAITKTKKVDSPEADGDQTGFKNEIKPAEEKSDAKEPEVAEEAEEKHDNSSDSDTSNESWKSAGKTQSTGPSSIKKRRLVRNQESRAPFHYTVTCCPNETFSYIASAIKHLECCNESVKFDLFSRQALKKLIQCVDFRNHLEQFPETCFHCPYRCKNSGQLSAHMKKLHMKF